MLTLAASSGARAQTDTSATTPCLDKIGGAEVAVDNNIPGGFVGFTLYDRTGAAISPLGTPGDPQFRVANRNVANTCDAIVDFPPYGAPPTPSNRIVQYPAFEGFVTFEFVYAGESEEQIKTYRIVYGDGGSSTSCAGTADAFFCPTVTRPNSGDSDFYVGFESTRVRVSPTYMWAFSSGFHYVDETIPGNDWVLPYQGATVCAGGRCLGPPPSEYSSMLLMPVDQVVVVGSPLTKRLSAPVLLPSNGVYNWMEGWLKLAFAPGAGLNLSSQNFSTVGMTFTASNPAQGWSGIRFNPGSGGSITGGTIERIRSDYIPAVTISGASPTISGVNIRDVSGGGISVTGSSTPLLVGNIIERVAGTGIEVYSSAGASTTIRGNLIQNGGDGVDVFFSGKATLTSNTIGGENMPNSGVGVRATYGSSVAFGSYPNQGGNRVTFNDGAGLLAQHDYTQVKAGAATNSRDNSFFGNGQPEARYSVDGEGPDAASFEGAVLYARYNWWGRPADPDTTTGALGGGAVITDDPNDPGPVYSHSGHGLLYVDPMLAQAPGGGARAAGGDAFASRTDEGDADESPRGLILAASEAEPTEALALLTRAAGDAGGGAAERVALGQVARLCTDTGVGASAEALLRGHGAAARRALVGCLTLTGRDAEALSLLAEPAGSAARGVAGAAPGAGTYDGLSSSLTAFQIHLGAGRTAEARGALTQALAIAPGDAGVRSAARALAVVTGDPSLLEAVAEQARAAADEAARRAADLAALKDGAFELAPARPNPSSGRSVVAFGLAEAADVEIAAYDVLGRIVARLASGPLAGGLHEAALDGSALAPGTYLLRMTATGSDGRTHAATERLTLTRP